MGAKNKLLSRGALIEQQMEAEEVKPVARMEHLLSPPILLHHKTLPSVIVKTKEKLEELIAAGYADHPGKVKKLPGWEHLYQEEEAKPEDPEPEPVIEETKGSIFDKT